VKGTGAQNLVVLLFFLFGSFAWWITYLGAGTCRENDSLLFSSSSSIVVLVGGAPKERKVYSYVTQMELIIITASACRAWSFCSTFINWLYWMRWAKFQVRQLECFFNISLSYIYTKCVYENEKVCLLPAWSLLDLRFLKILKWDWRGEQSFRCVSGTGTRRCSPARVKKKKICRHHLFWVILDSLFKPNIFSVSSLLFCIHKESNGEVMAWRGRERLHSRFFFSLFMLLTLCTKYNNFGSTGFFFNSFYYLINLKVWGSKVRERHVYY